MGNVDLIHDGGGCGRVRTGARASLGAGDVCASARAMGDQSASGVDGGGRGGDVGDDRSARRDSAEELPKASAVMLCLMRAQVRSRNGGWMKVREKREDASFLAVMFGVGLEGAAELL